MKQPPGFQLLHCLQSSGQGGLSTFRDSFEVAESLHEHSSTRPAFDALTSYPVSYHYNAAGKAFFDTKPTIELASTVDSRTIRPCASSVADAQSNQSSGKHSSECMSAPIRNINWSPPFQAPFRVDVGFPGSIERLRMYHIAAKAFSMEISEKSKVFEYKLGEGECVIFNNRRVLHGRTSFTSGSKARWLKGAYLDTDDFESQLRHRDLLDVL